MIEEDPEQDEMPPDSAECAALDDLTDALASGDVLATAKALRALESLDPEAAKSALGRIADALEDNEPTLRWLYPWRLKFAKRGGRGRPPDRPRTEALPFGIADAVKTALQKEKKVDNAVNAVAKQFKVAKSIVWAAHTAINKKK
jgi:hypothetical protein